MVLILDSPRPGGLGKERDPHAEAEEEDVDVWFLLLTLLPMVVVVPIVGYLKAKKRTNIYWDCQKSRYLRSQEKFPHSHLMVRHFLQSAGRGTSGEISLVKLLLGSKHDKVLDIHPHKYLLISLA